MATMKWPKTADLPPEEGTPAAEKPSYKNILKDKKKKEKRRRN
jgi:hypothetical protein